MSVKERRYLTIQNSKRQSTNNKSSYKHRNLHVSSLISSKYFWVKSNDWDHKSRQDHKAGHKDAFQSIDRVPPLPKDNFFFHPFLSSAGDTLESSSSLAFLGSIHQPRRSLPRSRPPDSSGCVSIEREYVAVRRIRCAYVCTRSRMCSIKRLRDHGSSLEECWSQRIISLV